MDIEKKREILQAAKTEIMRHRWDSFVDDPPSIAQGGKGVIVSGCPTRKRFGTNPPRSLLTQLISWTDRKAGEAIPVHPAHE
jgi:hypothetical protein